MAARITREVITELETIYALAGVSILECAIRFTDGDIGFDLEKLKTYGAVVRDLVLSRSYPVHAGDECVIVEDHQLFRLCEQTMALGRVYV